MHAPNYNAARQRTTTTARQYYGTSSDTTRNNGSPNPHRHQTHKPGTRHPPPEMLSPRVPLPDFTPEVTDESRIIEQLNAGNFNKEAIAAELDIDINHVDAIIKSLALPDPRLAAFRKHLKPPYWVGTPQWVGWRPPPMRPPAPPHYRDPAERIEQTCKSHIENHPNPPPRIADGTFTPTCDDDWDTEIGKMYRDENASPREIAQALDLPLSYIETVLPPF